MIPQVSRVLWVITITLHCIEKHTSNQCSSRSRGDTDAAHPSLCCCILNQLNLQDQLHVEHIGIVVSVFHFWHVCHISIFMHLGLDQLDMVPEHRKWSLSVPHLKRLFSFLGQFTLIALLLNPGKILFIPNCLMFSLNINTTFFF